MIMSIIIIIKKILNLPLVTRAGGQERLHRWRRRPGGKERSAGAKVVAAAPSDE